MYDIAPTSGWPNSLLADRGLDANHDLGLRQYRERQLRPLEPDRQYRSSGL
jgi:hypothetical protein